MNTYTITIPYDIDISEGQFATTTEACFEFNTKGQIIDAWFHAEDQDGGEYHTDIEPSEELREAAIRQYKAMRGSVDWLFTLLLLFIVGLALFVLKIAIYHTLPVSDNLIFSLIGVGFIGFFIDN